MSRNRSVVNVVCAAAVILLARAAVAQTPIETCATLLSCSTCLPQSGCGWAQDELLCLAGTSTGPNAPFSSTNWYFGSASCPSTAVCSTYSTCTSCISNSNCGWDGLSCFTGSNVGSVCVDGGITATVTGVSIGIVLVGIFIPVAVVASVTTAICFWYRRFYLVRRAAVVVTDVGLTTTIATPYVPVPAAAAVGLYA